MVGAKSRTASIIVVVLVVVSSTSVTENFSAKSSGSKQY